MNGHDLKGLQVRLTKATADVNMLKDEQAELSRRMASAKRLETQLKDEIRKQQEASKDPVVSEHAILRYLERKFGFSIEDIQAEILNEQTRAAIGFVGSGKVPLGGGLKAIVKNRTIVSVIPA